MNPETQLYQLLRVPSVPGKTGGDVLSFVSRVRSVGFRKAFELLGGDLAEVSGPPATGGVNGPPPPGSRPG